MEAWQNFSNVSALSVERRLPHIHRPIVNSVANIALRLLKPFPCDIAPFVILSLRSTPRGPYVANVGGQRQGLAYWNCGAWSVVDLLRCQHGKGHRAGANFAQEPVSITTRRSLSRKTPFAGMEAKQVIVESAGRLLSNGHWSEPTKSANHVERNKLPAFSMCTTLSRIKTAVLT